MSVYPESFLKFNRDFLVHRYTVVKVSCMKIQPVVLREIAGQTDRQTTRQTDRETNAGKTIPWRRYTVVLGLDKQGTAPKKLKSIFNFFAQHNGTIVLHKV